jgi:FKBP-type peptidyl-prolyl cis-trans isomerase FkpA
MFRAVSLLMILSLSFGLTVDAQSPSPNVPAPAAAPTSPATVPPLTDEEKTVYALGLLVQRSLRPFDLSPGELAIVLRALADGAAGKPAVDFGEWGPQVDRLAEARRGRVVAREKAAAVAYLAAAAEELGAVKTTTGLVYRNLRSGTGPSPTARDTVRVHYRGSLIDGTVFDSSYERKEPVAFRLGEVVPCWTEGVQRMNVGGRARLVCPSDLAYGDEGSPGIPGGAALVFEVELVGIVGAPAGMMRD